MVICSYSSSDKVLFVANGREGGPSSPFLLYFALFSGHFVIFRGLIRFVPWYELHVGRGREFPAVKY